MLKRLFLIKIAVLLFFAAPALGGRIIARAENEEQTRAIVTETSTDEYFNYRANNLLFIPKNDDFLGEIICYGEDYRHITFGDTAYFNIPNEYGYVGNDYINLAGFDLDTISGNQVVSLNENTRITLTKFAISSNENYIVLFSGHSVDGQIENIYYILAISQGVTFSEIATDIIPNLDEFYLTSIQIYKDSRDKVSPIVPPNPQYPDFHDNLNWNNYDYVSPYPYFNIGLNAIEARVKLALMPTAIIINNQNRNLYYNAKYVVMSTVSRVGATTNTQSAVINFSSPQNLKYQFFSFLAYNNYYGIFQKDNFNDEINVDKSIILQKNSYIAQNNINNEQLITEKKFSLLSACTGQHYSFDGETWYAAKCGVSSDTDVQNSIGVFNDFQNCVNALIQNDVYRNEVAARQDWSTPGGVFKGIITGLIVTAALVVLGPLVSLGIAAYSLLVAGNLEIFKEFLINVWNGVYSIIEPVVDFVGDVLEAGAKLVESVADFLAKNLPGVLTFIGNYWWALLILAGIIFISIMITRWKK